MAAQEHAKCPVVVTNRMALEAAEIACVARGCTCKAWVRIENDDYGVVVHIEHDADCFVLREGAA